MMVYQQQPIQPRPENHIQQTTRHLRIQAG